MKTNIPIIKIEKTDDTRYNIILIAEEVTESTIKNNMPIICINYQPNNPAPAIIEVP